jgi:hypothetical protein
MMKRTLLPLQENGTLPSAKSTFIVLLENQWKLHNIRRPEPADESYRNFRRPVVDNFCQLVVGQWK